MGTYSLGNLFVVYDIKRHVCAPLSVGGQGLQAERTYLSDSSVSYDNTLDGLHIVYRGG